MTPVNEIYGINNKLIIRFYSKNLKTKVKSRDSGIYIACLGFK